MVVVLPLNGIAPVNTYDNMKLRSAEAICTIDHPHLDHDHRKRKRVGLLTKYSLGQDLWRGPSRGVARLMRWAPYGIQVLSDCSETKICDQRITRVVHENVWLVVCQYGREMGFKTTHPLEVPVNNIASVKIAEAASDIGYLVPGMSAR